MSTRLEYSIATVACLTLMMACGRGGGEEQPQTSGATPAANTDRPAEQHVVLSGCLEGGAPGGAAYVLRNVQLEPAGVSDPHRNTTTPAAQGITEGSWVRLSGGQEMGAHAGRRVSVSGVVVDHGGNTIGTAGSSGVALPSGDRSEAASADHHSTKVKRESGRIARESMANGTAAEIRVTQVKDLGEGCQDKSIRR